MAFTCIAFMALGFIMAKRYVLSKNKIEKIEKYLTITRNGALDSLDESEKEELESLKSIIS